MKPDKETKIGAIMQIAPSEDNGGAMKLMVVEKIETWGVTGRIPGFDGTLSRTWSLIEPTGGGVVFDRDGKPFVAPAAPSKHHP